VSTESHLDGESMVAFVEGNTPPADRADLLAHLLDCGDCRQAVASVARLLEAPDVKREIDRLNAVPRRKQRRRVMSAVVAAGVLAAGLLFVFIPASWRTAQPRYREESLTGASAPRLVAPIAAATAVDAFRWTSVPRADRYRITVFARDGSVIWEAQTRDTAIALSQLSGRLTSDTILWRVEAHVGWEDRWTSSDLATLIVHRATSP
jgi:hypothetical protein